MKTDAELFETLGGRLKWARTQRKLSQPQLASAAGVSQGTIGNIEADIRKRPRELLKIANALQASPHWLETGKGDWQAIAPPAAPPVGQRKGDFVKEITPEEQLMLDELLDHFRQLFPSDRREKLAELAALAKIRKAERADLFEEAGLPRIMERAANASRRQTAAATVDPNDPALRQRPLPGIE